MENDSEGRVRRKREEEEGAGGGAGIVVVRKVGVATQRILS